MNSHNDIDGQVDTASDSGDSTFLPLFESAPVAMILTDHEGVITRINHESEKLFGYDAADLVGRQIEVLVPRRFENHAETRRRFIADPFPLTTTETMKLAVATLKDGCELPIEIKINPLTLNGSQYFLAAIQETTIRAEVRSKLENQVRATRKLLDVLPLSVIVFERDGKASFINARAQRVAKVSTSQFGNQRSFIAGTDKPYHEEKAPGFLAMAGHSTYVEDMEIELEKGSRIPVEMWAAPLLTDTAGIVQQAVVIASDITERRAIQRAEADAAYRNRAKSTFLANMSHEIRTPLNAILGFTQLIAQSGELQGVQQQNIETTMRSGLHLLNLINNVLDISKIEAGQISLEEAEFSLSSLCHTVESMFRPLAEADGLSFMVNLHTDLPDTFIGDEARIRQVLVNLVGNAIKFTEQGEVNVSVTLDDEERLLIKVQDTGPGIPTDQTDSLFTAFRRLTTKEAGTGLGLSISKTYVSLMGGAIDVETEIGKGSLFRVLLPLEMGSPSPRQSTTQKLTKIPKLAAEQDIPRVLIVDDSATNRMVLRQLLETAGFEVNEASDGEEGLATYKIFKPEVVLTDLHMPKMNGYETLDRIKQIGDCFVIAVTASVLTEEGAKTHAAGFDGFIAEPFHLEDVLKEIQRLTGVRFVDQDDASLPAAQMPDEKLIHTLRTLAPDSIRELREAAIRCDRDYILRLIDDHVEDDDVAQQLRSLVHGFCYEEVLRLLS